MTSEQKTSYRILIWIGGLGLAASIYNTFFNAEVDWYMNLISTIASVSLIYGAQQLKHNSQQTPKA